MRLFDLVSVMCDCTMCTVYNRYFTTDDRNEKLAIIYNDSMQVLKAKCESDNDSFYTIAELLNRRVVNFECDDKDEFSVYTEKCKTE